jgi:hypothetical protein
LFINDLRNHAADSYMRRISVESTGGGETAADSLGAGAAFARE